MLVKHLQKLNSPARLAPFLLLLAIEIYPINVCLNNIHRQEKMTALPTISSWNNFRALFPYPYNREGLEVRVVGIYQQADIRKRPIPPAVYRGNVKIVLNSSGGILLYPMWHPDAIRYPEEIERYEGQRVIVTGRVVPEAPGDPRGAATLIGPCFVTVDTIELAPLEEISHSDLLDRQGSDREDNTTSFLPTSSRNLTTISSWENFQTHFPNPYSERYLEELDFFEVFKVRVVGEYRQRHVRQDSSSQLEWEGNIEIAFDSNGGILLYPSGDPDAIRPEDEIRRYNGRRVEAIGELVPLIPRHLNSDRTLVGPYFATINTIRFVP